MWPQSGKSAARHAHHWAIALAVIAGLTSLAINAQVSSASQFPKTNFDIHSIEFKEVRSGGPPRDGIPAIDSPSFISSDAASEWLDADEPVISVAINGEARAYPIQILIWHEIVNDTLGGTPITVTFCPLCNSCIVFDRRVDGQVLDFGTTGSLRKSDLLMYDRQTETWWQQLIGTGVIGDLTGKVLDKVPAQIVSFADFRAAYPAGEVLSKDTGHRRSYGQNPYRGYDSITGRPFLFNDPIDKRLPPMERVLNISKNGKHKVYPFSAVAKVGVANDEFEGQSLVVFSQNGTYSALDKSTIADSKKIPSVTVFARELNGQTLTFTADNKGIRDEQTGSTWNLLGQATAGDLKGQQLTPVTSAIHFAFAWLAFNPDSEIYE